MERRPTLPSLWPPPVAPCARQDGEPLADEPDLIRRAAEQIVRERPDADADDVLLWARAQQQAGAPR